MARGKETAKLKAKPVETTFTLPYKFLPRSYQRELFAAFEAGYKRFVLNWHRRSGKDRACLNLMAVSMYWRPGLYLYVFPTKTLARDALWQALHSGGKFLDAFPEGWRDGEPNNTEMLIRLNPLRPDQPTGSIFKLTGADDPNSLRGLNPLGVVLSEFSQHDENVWPEIIAPILNENGGWCIFNSTPQGKNHFYDIYQSALRHPDRWFVSTKTILDTKRDAPGEPGGPVVPLSLIEADREEGIAEEVIQQESFCSFDGYQRGTIFGDVLRRAEKEHRIRPLVRDASSPVGVCFDIGLSDGTAAWFYQCYGSEYQFIDYAFTQGADHNDWWKILTEKPYVYGRILLPHDTSHERFGQEMNVKTFFQSKFRCPVIVAPKLTKQAGIDMVRAKFSKFAFDERACTASPGPKMPSGLEALKAYRRTYNEQLSDYSGEPVHDINSHAADALRTGVVGGLDGLVDGREEQKFTHAEMAFDLFSHDRPRNPREPELAFDVFAVR